MVIDPLANTEMTGTIPFLQPNAFGNVYQATLESNCGLAHTR